MKHRMTQGLAAVVIATGTMAGATMALASTAQGSTVRYRIIEKSFTGQPATPRNFTIKCPRGTTPIGGGGHEGQGSFGGGPDAGVFASDISLNHRGWTVSVDVGAGVGPTSFTADVICATN